MAPVLTGHRDSRMEIAVPQDESDRPDDCGASGRLVKNEEAGAHIESLWRKLASSDLCRKRMRSEQCLRRQA